MMPRIAVVAFNRMSCALADYYLEQKVFVNFVDTC